MSSFLGAENMPPYALEDDRIVEISGAVRSVYLALELSLSHLRKFLVDRSVIPLFEKVCVGSSLVLFPFVWHYN